MYFHAINFQRVLYSVLMKTLNILLLLQTAMIAVLFYKLVIHEDRPIEGPAEANGSVSAVVPEAEVRTVIASPGEMDLDEAKLRQIIRSELKEQFDLLAETEKEHEKQEPEIDPIENKARLNVVKQEIAYYIERGEISDLEMQELQTEISKLDSESRRMMMGELVRALNSGELRGRL